MFRFSASTFIYLLFGSIVHAADCSRLNEAEYNYSILSLNTINFEQLINLQNIIGTTIDGKWGMNSELAYKNYLLICQQNNDLNYVEKKSQYVGSARIVDYFENNIINEKIPYTECMMREVPIIESEQRGADDVGSFVGGAIIGGIIGKVVTQDDGGAAVGAILGGALANETQKNERSEQIVGYQNKEVCTKVYKIIEVKKESYSYSIIEFQLNGKKYSSKFIKD
ncbi:hypothetical protein N8935_06815 [Amylibacter sp.]|jgi:uncharacterized protein YcfJ|nr:hypothetical protein [Amylibacter sp.]